MSPRDQSHAPGAGGETAASGVPARDPVPVTVYTRPGCSLCEEAVAGLRDLRERGAPLRVEEVDIESDPALHKRLMERIPVIEIAGEPVCELWLDPDVVLARIGTLSE